MFRPSNVLYYLMLIRVHTFHYGGIILYTLSYLLRMLVIPYTYKLLRDAVFADNFSSTKIKSSKFFKAITMLL